MRSIALHSPRASLWPVTAQVTGWLCVSECVQGLSAATTYRLQAAHS